MENKESKLNKNFKKILNNFKKRVSLQSSSPEVIPETTVDHTNKDKVDAKQKPKKRKRKNSIFPDVGKKRALCFDVGIRHFATAVVTLEGDNDFEIEYLDCTDIVKSAGSNKKNSKEITAKLIAEYAMEHLLNQREKILKFKPHIIIIEQQAKKGIKFKGIGTVIQTFFYLNYKFNNLDPPPIIYQSGSQKLKVMLDVPQQVFDYCAKKYLKRKRRKTITAPVNFIVNPEDNLPIKKRKKKYKSTQYKEWKQNKNYSEDNLFVFLNVYNKCKKWLPYYCDLSKKDDIADAIFHSIFYLVTNSTNLAKHAGGIIYLKGDENLCLKQFYTFANYFPNQNPLATSDKKIINIKNVDIIDLCEDDEDYYECVDESENIYDESVPPHKRQKYSKEEKERDEEKINQKGEEEEEEEQNDETEETGKYLTESEGEIDDSSDCESLFIDISETEYESN